jgi:hypothetical protein
VTRAIGPTSGGTGWSTTRPAAKACRRSLLENSIGRDYRLRMVKLQKIFRLLANPGQRGGVPRPPQLCPHRAQQGMNPLPCCASLLRVAPGYQPR